MDPYTEPAGAEAEPPLPAGCVRSSLDGYIVVIRMCHGLSNVSNIIYRLRLLIVVVVVVVGGGHWGGGHQTWLNGRCGPMVSYGGHWSIDDIVFSPCSL